MLAFVEAGELRIGLPTAPLGIGGDGMGESLTAEVGRWVAEALGVQPRFLYTDTDAILEGIEDRELDLGFPVMPMTEGAVRSRKRSFTAPYFVAHQRVLLGPGVSDIAEVDRACAFGDARTQISVEDIAPGLTGVRSNDVSGCRRLLAEGIVQAIAAPDLLLFELEAELQGSELLDPAYNTEGYGAIVQFGETRFANFVDGVLSRAIDDGRWAEAYEDHIAPLTRLAAGPPDLTAEEAAALFPRGLKLD